METNTPTLSGLEPLLSIEELRGGSRGDEADPLPARPMTPKPTRVTNRIATLRSDRGLTQDALARAVGVTRQTVHAIEGGKYSPSLEVAFRIARHLDAELDVVFGYRD